MPKIRRLESADVFNKVKDINPVRADPAKRQTQVAFHQFGKTLVVARVHGPSTGKIDDPALRPVTRLSLLTLVG